MGTQHIIDEDDLNAWLKQPDLLPAPAGWDVGADGSAMPDWESIIRRQRAGH